MLSAILALALAAAPVQDTTHLVLVATTDVHGHAGAWDHVTDQPYPGGLVRAATVVDSLRARYPGRVVLVDAGDLLQGDPLAVYYGRVEPRDPHPVIETMNLMGYDAATPGNHEYDFGVDALRRAISGAAFRYVGANTYHLPADTLWLPRYTVIRRGDVRIAIAGFTTPGVMVWDGDRLRGRMRVAPIEPLAGRVVHEMRRDADLAVVLVHSGMDGSASYDTTGVGEEHVAATFAGLAERPDIVVVGHSHREMRDSLLGGVHFVQPKAHARSLSVVHLDLVRQQGRWRPIRVRAELVALDSVPPSPRVARWLAGPDSAVRRWVRAPIGRATGPMPLALARVEATPMLNFLHRVQRERTGADLSAASVFRTSAGLGPGEIRLADVAAIYPYENTLRAVRISGAQLRAYLEHSARYFRIDAHGVAGIDTTVPGYNYDVVDGASYEIDVTRPVGQRIRGLAASGRPVRATDSFTLAVNSYRQAGGGGYDMLRDAPVVYDRAENVRELLAEAIRARGTIDPAAFADTGWRIVPAAAAAALRAHFTAAADTAPRAVRNDSVVLRVLATSDLHGALAGAAALKATMDRAEAECRCPTVRLDAGDAMQGTLLSGSLRGRPVVEMFNRLGLDAAAVGNHDLDWSVDTLVARMAEARYPWLAANVFDSVTGRRPAWARPYVELTIDTLRVAVVGYLTADTKGIVRADRLAGLRIGRGRDAIDDVLTEVRRRRPHVTIVLAHAGAVCDSAGCRGEAIDLARALGPESADLLVGGHTHRNVGVSVAGLRVVETENGGTSLSVVDLVRMPAGGLEARSRIVPVSADSVTPDAAMAAFVETHRRRTDSLAHRVVARVKLPVPRAEGEFPLGNLIADARRNALRTDLGLVTNGGIRADLPAGTLTFEELYAVQPFRNALVTLTLTGAEVRRLLEQALRTGRPDAHIAGAVVEYDPRAREGRRVRRVTLSDGRRLQSRMRYTVATDDFVAAGGDGYTVLAGRPSTAGGLLDAAGLERYLGRLPQPVAAPADLRFIPRSR